MKISWKRKYPDAHIYEGETDSKFSVQIAPSAEDDEFAWVIFHKDSDFAQWGGGEPSVELSKEAAYKWLIENSSTWSVTNSK